MYTFYYIQEGKHQIFNQAMALDSWNRTAGHVVDGRNTKYYDDWLHLADPEDYDQLTYVQDAVKYGDLHIEVEDEVPPGTIMLVDEQQTAPMFTIQKVNRNCLNPGPHEYGYGFEDLWDYGLKPVIVRDRSDGKNYVCWLAPKFDDAFVSLFDEKNSKETYKKLFICPDACMDRAFSIFGQSHCSLSPWCSQSRQNQHAHA